MRSLSWRRPDGKPSLPHRTETMRGFRDEWRKQERQDASPRGSSTRQDEILEPLAQHRLLDLAGRGMWNFIDENDVVGHPPVGNLAAHEFQDFIPGGRLILPENDDEQRPLVPLRMLHADHRCFRHFGMADGEVLEVDRGNPLAARFDHVLGAVVDLHMAVAVDGGDVTGVEETLLVEERVILLKVGPGHAWSAYLEAARGLAVPGQPLAGIVGDFHLDHERRLPLFLLNVEPRVSRQGGVFGLEGAGGAERAHFGHAPGVDHLDAIDVLENFGYGAGAGRAADDDLLEMRQLAAGPFEVLQQHEPDRRYRGGAGHLVAVEQFEHRCSV